MNVTKHSLFFLVDLICKFEKYLYLQLKYIVKTINIYRISTEYSQETYNYKSTKTN